MDDILDLLAKYGYIILFFYSIGGGFFALLGASVLSSIGKMDIATSISVAFVSNAIGGMILFYIARYNKKDVLRYIKGHRRKLAFAHILIKRYDSTVIVLHKFIYGVKTIIPLAIGLTKYDTNKFVILNVIAASIWALSIGLIGFYSGEYIISFVTWLNQYSILTPVIAIIFLYLIYRFVSISSQKR